jgi:hypothetical protein
VPAALADRNPTVLLGLGGCRASWAAVGLDRDATGTVLQQQRWIGASALALLLAADGLALGGGVLLMTTTGAIPGPN